jgi:cyclin D5, plant
MGEAEEEYSVGCSFSLMCQEDSVGVFADGDLAEEEYEEEYVGHLVSKESSFCGSPSSSSSSSSSSLAFFDTGGGDELSRAGEDWFQCARRDTVKWILEVNQALFLGSGLLRVRPPLPPPPPLQKRAYFGFDHRTAYPVVSYLDRFCLR